MVLLKILHIYIRPLENPIINIKHKENTGNK